MRDVDMFDSARFGVSSSESTLMDPQQRMLLLLHSASKTGAKETHGVHCIGVGISSAEYAQLTRSHSNGAVTPYSATGASGSVACGRLSYMFGYEGFSISVDTACSSALVAAGIVVPYVRATLDHEGSVHGISFLLMPTTTKMFAVAGMLAPDGRCKTLDGGADGYVRGEAGAVAHLVSVDASDGGGTGGALVRGCAVNQDGRSSALTAPNGPAQQDAMRMAMRDARLRDAAHVASLQMHGTGTPLGDPIEVGAATAVLGSRGEDAGAVSLSASKTYIGHTEPAAGLVGVLAATAALAHAHAPAMLHLRAMNPHVRLVLSMGGACAFASLRGVGTAPCVADEMRTTGVSSFAFQGTNAHALVGRRCAQGGSLAVGLSRRHVRGVDRGERHWVTVEAHALHGFGAVRDGSVLEVRMRDLDAYMHDHRVRDQAVFPGAGYFEMASAAAVHYGGGGVSAGLRDVSVPSPLLIDRPSVLTCSLRLACGRVDVTSRGGTTTHMRGYVRRLRVSSACCSDGFGSDAASSPAGVDTSAHRARCSLASSACALYASMRDIGLMYGPAFRMLHMVRKRGTSDGGGVDEATGAVRQPDTTRSRGLLMHPATLDACMQLGNALELAASSSSDTAATARVPAGLTLYTTTARATPGVDLEAWASLVGSRDAAVTCSFGLRTASGAPAMRLHELVAKPMASASAPSAAASRTPAPAAYAISWLASAAVTGATPLSLPWSSSPAS